MYTPSQVSKMLSIPVSTLRRLSSELESLLSPRKNVKRQYTESDIHLFERAREMSLKGMRFDEIRQALAVVDEQKEKPIPGDTLALVPTIAGELERIDTAYREVLSQLERMRQEREKEQGERVSERERLARLEKWLALPWWRRFFTSPPK